MVSGGWSRMSWLKAGRIEREVEQPAREEERNGGGSLSI